MRRFLAAIAMATTLSNWVALTTVVLCMLSPHLQQPLLSQGAIFGLVFTFIAAGTTLAWVVLTNIDLYNKKVEQPGRALRQVALLRKVIVESGIYTICVVVVGLVRSRTDGHVIAQAAILLTMSVVLSIIRRVYAASEAAATV